MRLSSDQLRERLDAVERSVAATRGDDGPERSIIDLRAAHLRRRRRIAGAGVAGLAALVAVTVLVGPTFDEPDDQRLRTIEEPPPTEVALLPEPDVIQGDHGRNLGDGRSVMLSFEPPDVVFGPFGLGSQWTQPIDCPRQLRIAVTSDDGIHTGTAFVDPSAPETRVTKVLMPWNGGDGTGAGATVPDLAFVVTRPDPATTYQLIGSDESVVDESPSDGDALVLFGPSAVSPATPGGSVDIDATLDGAEGGAPEYRIRVVEHEGAIVSETPVPVDVGPGFLRTRRDCSVPDHPVDLGRSGAPADIPAETRAVEAVVASLIVGNAAPDALLGATDDSGSMSTRAGELGFAWADGTTIETAEIVWFSPIGVWVDVRMYLQPPGSAERAPVGRSWIRLSKRPTGWRLDRSSACALLAAAPGGAVLGSASGDC